MKSGGRQLATGEVTAMSPSFPGCWNANEALGIRESAHALNARPRSFYCTHSALSPPRRGCSRSCSAPCSPPPHGPQGPGSFTLPQLSYAFPAASSPPPRAARPSRTRSTRKAIATLWVASAPDWRARRGRRRRTRTTARSSGASHAHDGATVLYARGGDHRARTGSRRAASRPDPSHAPATPTVRIYTVSASGGAAEDDRRGR